MVDADAMNRSLLSAFSDGADLCLHECFELRAGADPTATALVCGADTVSYGELNARANRIARYLRDAGVSPDSRVVICMERGTEMVVAMLAVLKAGGAYVPVDPSYPPNRVKHIIGDCEPTLALTCGALTDDTRDALRGETERVVDLNDDVLLWRSRSDDNVDRGGLRTEHLAYVIYTSGSTGAPKGVMVEHRNVVASTVARLETYGRYERFLLLSSIAFDSSVAGIFGTLASGGTLYVAQEADLFSPPQLRAKIVELEITSLLSVPSLLQAIFERAFRGRTALRHVIAAGESCPPSLVSRVAAAAPGAGFYNEYGPTEAAVWATVHRCEASASYGTVPIGHAISCASVHILDAALSPVPSGQVGELYIGGSGVARGYWNGPELTAERFISGASVDGGRLYRTGDLGRLKPDGSIEFVGRNDSQLKIRGFRVELGEIEAFTSRYAGIREAVVVAHDRAGEKRLAAYFTREASIAVDVQSLRAYLTSVLPEHMVPAAYMEMDAFPLTPNGKIDRSRLPDPTQPIDERPYEFPVGEVEATLARIWGDVLGLERIGRNDNFFELGGHSLLLVRVVDALESAGLCADVRGLFLAKNLTESAAYVVPAEQGIRDQGSGGIAPDCDAITPEMLPLVSLTQREIDAIVASTPGGSRNVQDIYPLAPLQEGMFFHHVMERQGDPYLLHIMWKSVSRAQIDAIVVAIREIVARHDVLRTAIQWEGLREPVQVVLRHADLIVEQHPVGDSGDITEQLRSAYHPGRYRLDLRRAPLLRLGIAADEAGKAYALILVFHHLVLDHVAIDILMEEVRAHLRDGGATLPPPVPFRSFVARARYGTSLEEHERFFRRMLAGIEETTAPFGNAEVHDDGSEIVEARQPLSQELESRLRSRARALGVSVASLSHVAWARVVAATSMRTDVVFGSVLSGRMLGIGAERAMGLLINTLPIRMCMDGMSVERSVRETHELLAELLRHEHAPLTLAQRCSGLPPSVPLFSSLLNYVHTPRRDENHEAYDGLETLQSAERTNYPFVMSVEDFGDEMLLIAQARSSSDAARMCALMSVAFDGLLTALERDAHAPILSVCVLPEPERRTVLVEWNATEAQYPSDRTVHALFEMQAEKTPDAVAIIDATSLTYAELNARANQLAWHLRDLGVEPKDRVGVCLDRSCDLVIAQLAILKCGAMYVPLDQQAPRERQEFMLGDCDVAHVISRAGITFAQRELTRRIDVDTTPLTAYSSVNPGVSVGADAPAYIMYTSGSTGEPKGVVIPHRAIVRLVINGGYCSFRSSDRVAFAANPAFDASTMEVWAPLLNGGAIVVVRQSTLLTPEALCERLGSEGVTILWMTSGLFTQYAPSMGEAFRKLRYLIVGGDVLNIDAVRTVLENSPPQHLVNGYGPTESTTFALTHEIVAVPGSAVSIPIGRPIGNTRAYILDDALQPVPLGAVGELYIGGAGVAHGYWNRAQLTAERFIPSPFVAGDRLYRTGDLVRYLPDGAIEFVGRNDFQVKIRGFRIELGEIESRLGAFAGIREALVLAREDVPGEKRLVAYYTCAPDAKVSVETLRSHLVSSVPEYMVPSAFVGLESFPLTPNGKVDRRALPPPDGSSYRLRPYEAPVGPIEAAIAGIWTDVLKVDRVGRFDNFFELGGHSLLVVRAIEAMRRAGMLAEPRTLFASPNLAEFARAYSNDDAPRFEVPANRIGPDAAIIVPEMLSLIELTQAEIDDIVARVPGGASNVQEIYPLGPLQEGLLFHHRLESEGDPYLLRITWHCDSEERLGDFIDALRSVVARHDMLRSAILWEGLREPVQVVHRRAELAVEHLEFDADDGDVTEQVTAHCDPRHYRLDLRHAPLLRLFTSYDARNDRWVAALVIHHAAVDHMAFEILLNEVQAFLEGREGDLDAPVPLRSFVAHAKLGKSRDEHEAFFRNMLADVEEPTLPYGLANVHGDGSAVGEFTVELESALATRIRACARALGVSSASIFHVAWARVLAAASGRDDILFGTVLLGRLAAGPEVGRAFGLLINTLPVRVRLGGHSIEVAVRNTHALLADLVHHEHAELSLAQRCSALGASSTLFNAVINYRHNTLSADEITRGWRGIEMVEFEERTNYPIGLSIDDYGQAFSMTAQVVESLDGPAICRQMLASLQHLVDGLETAPLADAMSIGVLTESERQRILVEWNQTETPYPSDWCVHELFEEQVAATPHAIALVHEERELTYAHVNAEANRLASYLRSIGVKPESRVALCMERSPDLIVGILAILKSGAAYVPLDPSHPMDRIRRVIDDCAPVAILTHREVSREVREVLAADPTVVDVTDDAPAWAALSDANSDRGALSSSNLAYIIYTSGSTGEPKGVMIEHRSLGNLALEHVKRFSITPDSRVLQFASVSFDGSVSEIFAALLGGAALVLPSSSSLRIGRSLAEFVDRHYITHATLTPAVLATLSAQTDLTSIRTLVVVGETLEAALVNQWSSKTSVFNGYGPTEGTVCTTLWQCASWSDQNPPIGRPIGNVRTYVLDRFMQPVPVGVAGELYIGGAGVARGYWNRPELTTERFIASSFSKGDRLYKTGDIARYQSDGTIEFIGRNDFQVKIRGQRIELGEIESRLGTCAGVQEAVVLAREDVLGEKRLVAYYSCDPGESPSVDALRSQLASSLPEYMVPSALVRLETFPLTPSGKVDRKALPSPDASAYVSRAYAEPIGDIETAISRIWSELLNLDRVGRDDNFFELGGHSLLLMRAVERMRAVDLYADIRSLFVAPTLSDVAKATSKTLTAAVEVPKNLISSETDVITPEMLTIWD